MMKRRNLIAVLGLVLAVISCQSGSSKDGQLAPEKIPVEILSVQQDTLSTLIHASGHFTTGNETPLSFKNGGIIANIYVHEGEAVKAGQILATVKATGTKTALSQAKLGYKKAKRDYERAVNLYKDSVATLESKQNAKTALNMAEQRLELAQFNQQQSAIRAMHDGYVLQVYLEEGQLAGAGTPVILVNSTGSNQWKFKTSVSATQWAALQIGDKAEITTNIAPNARIQAKVFRKNKGVNPQTGGFSIQLAIKDKAGVDLASGLFGEATLHPSQQQVAWQIPYDALLDGNSDYGYVFVTNDKKHAQKIKVHIAGLTHEGVLIDRGLEEVKYVIISGSAYLQDGSEIVIKKQ